MNTNRLEKNYSINFIKEKVLDKKNNSYMFYKDSVSTLSLKIIIIKYVHCNKNYHKKHKC